MYAHVMYTYIAWTRTSMMYLLLCEILHLYKQHSVFIQDSYVYNARQFDSDAG